MSQCNDILNYLISVPGRKIDTWTSYELFHCTTLAVRIQDLRHDLKVKPLILNGKEYFIDDELVTENKKTFSRYFLSPLKPKEKQMVMFDV